FLLALADAITVTLNNRDLGVMEQSIQQRDDTSRIGEYFVPFLEGTIGRQDDRLAFVTPVNDLVEQIGRLVVKGQISDFIDAQQTNVGISAQFATAAFRGLPVQV